MTEKSRTKIRNIFNKLHLPFLVLLSASLNIYNLWKLGYGNTYYAAAIKSMLTSFSNFFFLSLDSTGFISVDKSPLSLWIDAIFAKIFGFSGMAILIPHAIEGILVTILVYAIVRRCFGKAAGFISALIITLSPVNVAVYRNNTPDALLLVFLLLSIWFILDFFKQNKAKYIILSAAMIGLGFNTKMLQAFLILPAIITAIMVFTNGNILNRLKYLFLFLVVTAIVSFSWITIVDLTPIDLRPYVGSSTSNSAWDLAFNYNGTQRLTGEDSVGNTAGFNVGDASLTRLFTGEMGTQTGWFLVSGLLFSVYCIIKNFKQLWHRFINKIETVDKSIILAIIAIIFFATEFVFFSYAGFFHSYYLNILAVPISIIIGALFSEFCNSKLKNRLMMVFLGASLFMQVYLIIQASYATIAIPVILITGLISLTLYFAIQKRYVKYIATALLLFSLMITPFIWSAYTTIQANTASAIFIGGPGVRSSMMAGGMGGRSDGGPTAGDGMPAVMTQTNTSSTTSMQRDGNFTNGNNNASTDGAMPGGGPMGGASVSSTLVEYIKENSSNEKYFVAVLSSSEAASFILDYDITNIMTLGGFSGRDQAITLDELKETIDNNEIHFFYINSSRGNDGDGGSFNGSSEITSYISDYCTAVSSVSGLYYCE